MASVAIEKLLKKGNHISALLRNVYLALTSLVIAITKKQYNKVMNSSTSDGGWFLGSSEGVANPWENFTVMTWICVIYVACGGILVGMVIKYLNALLKDITLGFSIVLAAIGSMIIFKDVSPNPMFIAGALLVVSSVVLYGNLFNSSALFRKAEEVKGKNKKQ